MTDNSTNTSGTPGPAKPSGLSTQSIILIVSVALNIFVIGVLVGIGPRLLFHGGPPPGDSHFAGVSPADTMRSFFRVMHTMPDDIRAKFRKQMKETKGEVRPVWRGLRQNREKTLDILTTAPLDHAALSDIFADQNALRQQAEQISQTALLNFLASLTEEEKALFAQELKKAVDDGLGGPSKGPHPGAHPSAHPGAKWQSFHDRPGKPFREFREKQIDQDNAPDPDTAPPPPQEDDVIPPAE